MTRILKNENIFLNVRLVYIVCVLLYSVARQIIVATQPLLMHASLNILAILVAGAIFLWDIIFFRNVLKTKYIWILVALFVMTGISTLLNYEYAFADNIKAAANMFIQFFVLFAVGSSMSKERIKRDVMVIGNALGALWMVSVAISLVMYFFDINYMQTNYIWGEPTLINQGFVHVDDGAVVMRLWGVFVDPNFAAAISIIVICFAIFLMHTAQKRWVKALHITNIVMQFLYVVLSNSRMALIILLFLVFVGCWYISIKKIRNFKKSFIAEKRLVREIVAIVLAAAMTVGCYLGVIVSKKALPYAQYGVTSLVHSISGTYYGDDTFEEGSASLDRQDISDKNDISNGRLAMWGEGFNVLKKSPVIGVGPRSYHLIANLIDGNMSIVEKSIHNSYMELLMGNGIVGFLLLLIFFVLCAKDALILRFKNSSSLFTVGILMLIVLSALAGGMFISSLFYYLSGISVVAFCMLGYAISYMQCEKNEDASH